MAASTNRRNFLQASAAVGVGYWAAGGVSARASRMAVDRIRFACIGIGGKGSSDTADAAKHGDIIGVCDIDEQRLDGAGEKYKGAKKFFDYRLMLERLEDQIDAVTVSTPDHSHFPAAAMAMKMGKHCFCQKPLTHSVWEARELSNIATDMKVQTQMGNQGTANDGLRQAAAQVKAGAIGDVTEVHVWTNRPVWPQGGEPPKPEPCPGHIKWDLWIGPAPYRPYAKGYHPFSWRGFWDFGTGALGDMACHTVNMPYAALDLSHPVSIKAQTSGHDKNYYPKWSVIDFEFPANDWRGPLKMTWYDGGKLPDEELIGEKPQQSGSLLIGSQGKIYSPGDYGGSFRMIDGEKKEIEWEKSPGHFVEFAQAITEGKTAKSNIPGYSGPLTELILLGNLAVYADGPKVLWDAKNLKATVASDELNTIVTPAFRSGYDI